MYGTLCKLRIPRLGGLVITTFNMVLGGLELLALPAVGHHPRVGTLYRSLGLDIFADVPFFTGFTLRSALLLVLRRHLLRRHRLSAHRQDHGIHLRDRGLLRLSDQARSGNASGGGLLPARPSASTA